MAFFPKNIDNGLEDFNLNNIILDLSEDDDYYYFDIQVPGKKKESISVRVKDNKIKISIEEEKEENYDRIFIISEIIHDEMEREIELEQAIDKENYKASIENGILKLVFKKLKNKEFGELIKIS